MFPCTKIHIFLRVCKIYFQYIDGFLMQKYKLVFKGNTLGQLRVKLNAYYSTQIIGYSKIGFP